MAVNHIAIAINEIECILSQQHSVKRILLRTWLSKRMKNEYHYLFEEKDIPFLQQHLMPRRKTHLLSAPVNDMKRISIEITVRQPMRCLQWDRASLI